MADTKNVDPPETELPAPEVLAGITEEELAKERNKLPKEEHPSGKESYGTFMQIIRGSCFALYFNSCIVVYVIQVLFINRIMTNIVAASSLPSSSGHRCTLSTVTGTTLGWL